MEQTIEELNKTLLKRIEELEKENNFLKGKIEGLEYTIKMNRTVTYPPLKHTEIVAPCRDYIKKMNKKIHPFINCKTGNPIVIPGQDSTFNSSELFDPLE